MAASFKADLRSHAHSTAWEQFRELGAVYTGGPIEAIPQPENVPEFAAKAAAGLAPLLPVACRRDDVIVVADLARGEVWQELASGPKHLESVTGALARGRDEATAFAVHPRGRFVATAGQALVVRLWSCTEQEAALDASEEDTETAASKRAPGRLVWRVEREIRAHTRPVVSMAFDASGTLLATGGADRACFVWDVAGGYATHSLRGHRGVVSMVRFHPDAARAELVTATDAGDTALRVWSLGGRAGQRQAGGSGSASRGVCIMESDTAHSAPVDDVAFAGETDAVAGRAGRPTRVACTVARDRTMVVWAVPEAKAGAPSRAWRAVSTVPLYEAVPRVLSWPEGGPGCRPAGHAGADGFFLTVGRRGLVRLWRVAAGGAECGEAGRRTLAELAAPNEAAARAAAADAQRAAAAETGTGLGGEAEAASADRGEFAAWAMVGSAPDGRPYPLLLAATGTSDVHMLQAGGVEGQPRLLGHRGAVVGHAAEVSALEWVVPSASYSAPPERTTAGVVGDAAAAAAAAAAAGGEADESADSDDDAESAATSASSVSSSSSSSSDAESVDTAIAATATAAAHPRAAVAVAAASPVVHLMDPALPSTRPAGSAAQGAVMATLRGHTQTVLALAASPDGALLATASKDGTCRIFDVATGTCVGVCAGHTEAVTAVRWVARRTTFQAARDSAAKGGSAGASQSLWLVTGSRDRTLQRWEVLPVLSALGAPPADPSAPGCTGLLGLPVYEGVAAAAAAPVTLSSAAATRAHEKEVNAVDVSPNDKLVASAGADKTVKLWSAADLRPVATLSGHKRGVWAVRFSPSEQVLATAAADRTVRVWSVTERRCLRTLEGHTSSVLALAFLRGGKQLLSSGADGLLKLWSVAESDCVWTGEAHEDRAWALAVRPPRTGASGAWSEDAAGASSADGAPAGEAECATGAGDGTLRLWRDTTAEQTVAAAKEAEQREAQEGRLLAAMATRDYAAASALCLELEKPQRLRAILDELLVKGPAPKARPGRGPMSALGAATGDWTSRMHAEYVDMAAARSGEDFAPQGTVEAAASLAAGGAIGTLTDERRVAQAVAAEAEAGIDGEGPGEGGASEAGQAAKGDAVLCSVLGGLPQELLGRMLRWAASWNTRAGTAALAHRVIGAALRTVPAPRLLGVPGFGAAARAAFAYGARHATRCEHIEQAAYVIDAALAAMAGGGIGGGSAVLSAGLPTWGLTADASEVEASIALLRRLTPAEPAVMPAPAAAAAGPEEEGSDEEEEEAEEASVDGRALRYDSGEPEAEPSASKSAKHAKRARSPAASKQAKAGGKRSRRAKA